GSIKAVAGSGIASMSEASMLFQPRMLEPSKPRPSAKDSSVSSLMGMLKCCQVPKVSTNFISTILAPLFFANSNTLLGVLMYDFIQVSVLLRDVKHGRRLSPRPRIVSAKLKLAGCCVVSFFAMFVEIQPCGLHFFRRTQAYDRLHQECDDSRADNGQDQCQTNGF